MDCHFANLFTYRHLNGDLMDFETFPFENVTLLVDFGPLDVKGKKLDYLYFNPQTGEFRIDGRKYTIASVAANVT